MQTVENSVFVITYSLSKIIIGFLFLTVISIIMMVIGVWGFVWITSDFMQIDDSVILLLGAFVMVVVSSLLFYSMILISRDIYTGKPMAIISKHGVEGRGYLGWKVHPWSEILYASKERYGNFVVKIEKFEENVKRMSPLKSFIEFWGSDGFAISTMFSKQSSRDIAAAFDRFHYEYGASN